MHGHHRVVLLPMLPALLQEDIQCLSPMQTAARTRPLQVLEIQTARPSLLTQPLLFPALAATTVQLLSTSLRALHRLSSTGSHQEEALQLLKIFQPEIILSMSPMQTAALLPHRSPSYSLLHWLLSLLQPMPPALDLQQE